MYVLHSVTIGTCIRSLNVVHLVIGKVAQVKRIERYSRKSLPGKRVDALRNSPIGHSHQLTHRLFQFEKGENKTRWQTRRLRAVTVARSLCSPRVSRISTRRGATPTPFVARIAALPRRQPAQAVVVAMTATVATATVAVAAAAVATAATVAAAVVAADTVAASAR